MALSSWAIGSWVDANLEFRVIFANLAPTTCPSYRAYTVTDSGWSSSFNYLY